MQGMFLDGFWTGNKRRKGRGFPGFLSRGVAVAVYSLSRVQFSATQRTQTVACQFLCPRDFLGKNTGVGCHFLLQGIFLTQGSNPCLLHLLHPKAVCLSLEPPGKPLFHFRWDYCKLSENLQVNWLVAVPPCGAEESFGSEGMPWH